MLLKTTLKKVCLPFFAIASLFITNQHYADSELELLYTAANADYKPFESSYGFSISGKYNFENGLFISGFFNETDFLASGPEVGSVNVESWLEAGIGYTFEHDWGQFYSLITFETITAKNQTYDGYGAHFGYQKNFSANLSTILQFGYLDTGFHDYQLQAKVKYKITKDITVSLGLRDYDDWDYTSYEAGVMILF